MISLCFLRKINCTTLLAFYSTIGMHARKFQDILGTGKILVLQDPCDHLEITGDLQNHNTPLWRKTVIGREKESHLARGKTCITTVN